MKENKFNTIVADAISNMEAWNKKVKKKKFHLYESDSYEHKEIKIYRYLNESCSQWSKKLKLNTIDSPELF